jgi:hypothetical protein
MSEFKREQRYIVIKISDAKDALDDWQLHELQYLLDIVSKGRSRKGKPRLKCVVVESDWPIYEQVWDMIKHLTESKQGS